MAHRALDEALAMAREHLQRALAAHRPAQPVRLARGEPGEGFGHFHHLVLKDDRAERLLQDPLERGVLVGNLVRGVFALSPQALDVGVDRPSLDRAGADDRDLDRQVLEVGRARAAQRLHLRAALDLKDADRVGAADRLEGARVVEGDPREIDALAASARDQLHAALHRREHSQAE